MMLPTIVSAATAPVLRMARGEVPPRPRPCVRPVHKRYVKRSRVSPMGKQKYNLGRECEWLVDGRRSYVYSDGKGR